MTLDHRGAKMWKDLHWSKVGRSGPHTAGVHKHSTHRRRFYIQEHTIQVRIHNPNIHNEDRYYLWAKWQKIFIMTILIWIPNQDTTGIIIVLNNHDHTSNISLGPTWWLTSKKNFLFYFDFDNYAWIRFWKLNQLGILII